MLTLKAPLQLHTAQPLTVGADAFGERIRGNYGLLGTHFAPKDLLFLMTAPPELPEDLGGMTTLVNQQNQVDIRSVSMDVVNNVVNRILLEGTEQFTYQDQVYITTVLNRLGITNVAQFMEQARYLRTENERTVQMTRLYRDELERLIERRTAGEPTPALPLPPREDEAQPPRTPDPRVLLALDILNRLDTTQIYETVYAFQHSWSTGPTTIRNQELRLSEQLRFSNQVSLAETKQTLYQQPRLELLHHINAYEAGLVIEAPENEEAVLSQAAAAALLSAVDSTVVQVLNQPQYRAEQWLQIQNALWQTAENSLSRFESYHTQPQTLLLRESESRDVWYQYAQELLEYQTLHRLLTPAAGKEGAVPPPTAERGALPPMVWKQTQEGDEVDQRTYEETLNETVNRLEQRFEAAQPPQAKLHTETLRETLLRQREQERQTETQKLRETVLQKLYPGGVPTAPGAEVSASGPEGSSPRSLPEVPLTPLTPEEAEELAPEVLREELERIDQRNRTLLQTIQAQEQAKPLAPLAQPDLRQTMRTALRALEEPEAVLQELRESRERQAQMVHPALTAHEEVLLAQAQPQERALYEAVLAYQKDPEAALAKGLLRPASQAALHADLRTQAPEPEPVPLAHAGGAEAQRELVREQAQSVLERMIHVPGGRQTVTETLSAPPSAVRFVHKQAAPDVTEELLEQLTEQRRSELQRTESHQQVTRQESRQVDVKQIEKTVVSQTTEDITELVNRTLARQMRTISDQVYRQMEKRLQTERSRRGRL